MKKRVFGILFASAFLYACQSTQAQSGCPKVEDLKQNLKELVNRDFTIASARPMNEMRELCEVVVKIGLKPVVVYTNKEGKNIIVGNVFNLETKENITQRAMSEHMSVGKDILSKLEEHVNIVEGKGQKFVYYINDPDCPFCQKFSPMLKKWAKEKEVQIKVILYPLPIHPDAKAKSIALICDKKGYDDIHSKDLKTKNQCDQGKKAVEANMKLLQELGVSGTPTIIGMNGRYIVGLPRSPEELDSLIQ